MSFFFDLKKRLKTIGVLGICVGISTYVIFQANPNYRFILFLMFLCILFAVLFWEWVITARKTKSLWPGCLFILAGSFSCILLFYLDNFDNISALYRGCTTIKVGCTPIKERLFFKILLVVFLTDILAYFGGRLIGGPKLCPSISPNKTLAGFLSPLIVMPPLLFIFLKSYFTFRFSMYIFLLIVCLGAQGGDLLESWIKRRGGLKDAGFLLPGHGGLLDRFDSIFGAFFTALLAFGLYIFLFCVVLFVKLLLPAIWLNVFLPYFR